MERDEEMDTETPAPEREPRRRQSRAAAVMGEDDEINYCVVYFKDAREVATVCSSWIFRDDQQPDGDKQ